MIALICALLGGVAGAYGVLLIQNLQTEEVPETDVSYLMQSIRENTAIEIVEAGTGQLMTPAKVYAANVGSTVGITTSVTTNIWGFQTTSAASGSGFIISTDGYILTNHHVIEDADSITVSLFDGATYDAALIGYDESNDIAVLKVEAENLSPVIPVVPCSICTVKSSESPTPSIPVLPAAKPPLTISALPSPSIPFWQS